MINNNNNILSNNKTNNFINNPFSRSDDQTTDSEISKKSSFSTYHDINKITSQNPTPKHNTSQKHKTPMNKYSINPIDIPRPNQENEIYINKDKTHIYETNIGSLAPNSNSFYLVKETQNSSCEYIRPTLNILPPSQSFLDETGLSFGLCIQPFNEEWIQSPIPKVEIGENFFRCKKCKSYINNKYNITFTNNNINNKQIAICNICHNENDFDLNIPGVKNEYLNDENTSCPELIIPTIDFIAPKKFKSKKIFIPHYLFMIDISETSYQLSLPSYILNCIKDNLDSIHNSENSYIAFALYDEKRIYYFYIEKDDIRLSIMADIQDPFCPLSLKKLYIKIGENKEKISLLFEKITIFIEEKNKNSKNNINTTNRQISTITGCAIKSGVDSLLENGGRVMIFTCNPCFHGFGGTVNRENYNKINEKDTHKLNPFFPQNNLFVEIGEKSAKNKIVIDQFIFLTELYDISTYSIASNLSGGEIFFYNDNHYKGLSNSIYEKLYYDITRILTRPNYYNCKFMLRYSKGLDCSEILGQFNKKLGEAFELGGCDPDYCYYYNMRLTQNFKKGDNLDIQLAVLYEDNYSDTYVRVFNYTFSINNEVAQLYGFMDIDAITKSIIYKSLSLIYNSDKPSIIKYLEDKIINSFKYYRLKEKKGTRLDQLILPLSLQYLPLYINSFLKLGIFSEKIDLNKINQILYISYKLLREPIFSTIKFLYPKFYRIDDIEKDQYDINKEELKVYDIGLINKEINAIQKPLLLRLSKDIIDFDCAYLIDDGEFIYIFIFNQIDIAFYFDLFGTNNFEETKKLGINALNPENNSELNQRILNIITQLRKENKGCIQPIRLFFIEEKDDIINPFLNNLLKEDKIGDICNYPEYLCTIHQKIQERIQEY